MFRVHFSQYLQSSLFLSLSYFLILIEFSDFRHRLLNALVNPLQAFVVVQRASLFVCLLIILHPGAVLCQSLRLLVVKTFT